MAGEIKVGMRFGTFEEKKLELQKRTVQLHDQGIKGTSVYHDKKTNDDGSTFEFYRIVTSKGYGWGAPKLPNGKEDRSRLSIYQSAPSKVFPNGNRFTTYESFDGFEYTCMGEDGKFNKIISPDGKQSAYDDNGNGIVDANEICKDR